MTLTPDSSTTSAQVYNDFSGLNKLKSLARKDQGQAAGAVARQFEGVFLQMMLKSMRQAKLTDGGLDGKDVEFYRDMFDQQLAVHLSDRGGIGLAKVIAEQIGGAKPHASGAAKNLADYRSSSLPAMRPLKAVEGANQGSESRLETAQADSTRRRSKVTGTAFDSPSAFVQHLWPAARQAAQELGVPPEALLAQAALETGWGQHQIPRDDGTTSHNLFGIKADRRWQGDLAYVNTLEFESGVAVKKKAAFRAYDDYGDCLQDYVKFVKGQDRYQGAVDHAEDPKRYFQALQQGGYATDPRYADKVLAVLQGPEMQAALKQVQTSSGRPI